MAKLAVLPYHLPEGTEENHKKLGHDRSLQTQTWIQDLPNIKRQLQQLGETSGSYSRE
jgi:ABC-type uncharacterized transport system YnjBCD substrate-binding protein